MLHIQELAVHRGQGSQQHKVKLSKLTLPPGQVLAITGPSGCGKSTLLECIGLLLRPDSVAQYRLGRSGLDISDLLSSHNDQQLAAIRGRHLGFMLQSGGLLPFLTVAENIQLPRRLLGLSAQSERVNHALDCLKVSHLVNKHPKALSIGERQRIAFIRAMAHEPDILLADEPTAALDPHSAHAVFELFLLLVAELQLGALVVSHDWNLLQDFSLPRMVASYRQGETQFDLEP